MKNKRILSPHLSKYLLIELFYYIQLIQNSTGLPAINQIISNIIDKNRAYLIKMHIKFINIIIDKNKIIKRAAKKATVSSGPIKNINKAIIIKNEIGIKKLIVDSNVFAKIYLKVSKN